MIDYYGYIVRGMKYGERLKLAREHARLTQAALAEKIGNQCTQENISKLERGDATGSEYTVQFAEACGVNPGWLATEKGGMIGGVYVTDPKIQHLVRLVEPMPDYALDHAVRDVAEIAQLIKAAASTKKNGTQ